jgi:hypothetical protein
MTRNSLEESIRELSTVLRQFATTMKALSGLSGAGANPIAGVAGLIPGGEALGFAMGAMNLLDLFRKGNPEVHLHQEVVINIGEGVISEKVFWDNLVHYHILPGLERGGFIPVRTGGRG